MNETYVVVFIVFVGVAVALVLGRAVWFNMERARLFTEAKWKYDEASMSYTVAGLYYQVNNSSVGDEELARANMLSAKGDELMAKAKAVRFNPFKKGNK